MSKRRGKRQGGVFATMEVQTVDYTKPVTPVYYRCAHCGATNCKLWREYETFGPTLLCARCAVKDQGKNIDTIDFEGKHFSELLKIRVDHIGWYVPAVPTQNHKDYWGYTSVPDEGVKWWKGLPTYSDPVKKSKHK